MSLCALAFISCQKEEMTGNDPVSGKYSYEFTAYQQPESKATVGDKVDGKWPVLWSAGDQMGVYKSDGTFVGVASLKDESAGLNEGKFSVFSNVELTAGDALYFSYPYVENAAISTGKIAAKQTLGASGVGANAVAYAEVEYNPGNTQFVLTHTNAYLKFNIKSDEFAGYNLNGVTLWATGAELSGDVAIADALTVTNAGDYVKSTLAAPVTVSADQAQPVWVAALPGDLTGKTVYAIVHMTGVAGTETATHTVTLPVKLNGAGALPAGSVTEINLPSLTKALAPAWYEPVETRYIAAYGDGWSYGPENTVIFTNWTDSKNVSLKARGNFMKVKEPKFVQMCYLVSRNHGTKKVTIEGTDITPDNLATDVAVGDDCSVDVICGNIFVVNYAEGKREGQMAGMYVKDASKNVIWGVNLWLTVNPFVTVEYNATETYQAGAVLDRDLGADNSAKIDSWRTAGCYFQWGRPFAFPDNTKSKLTHASSSQVTSLDVSASNPYTIYYRASGNDWYHGEGSSNDFWGNPNNTTAANTYVPGCKSIFDPCPKGYMVVCPTIIKEVEDNWSYTNSFKDGTSLDYVLYKDVAWPLAGGFNCDLTNGVNFKSQNAQLAYWSNSNNGADRGRSMFFTTASETVSWSRNRHKYAALSVRCMVDTENR